MDCFNEKQTLEATKRIIDDTKEKIHKTIIDSTYESIENYFYEFYVNAEDHIKRSLIM